MGVRGSVRGGDAPRLRGLCGSGARRRTALLPGREMHILVSCDHAIIETFPSLAQPQRHTAFRLIRVLKPTVLGSRRASTRPRSHLAAVQLRLHRRVRPQPQERGTGEKCGAQGFLGRELERNLQFGSVTISRAPAPSRFLLLTIPLETPTSKQQGRSQPYHLLHHVLEPAQVSGCLPAAVCFGTREVPVALPANAPPSSPQQFVAQQYASSWPWIP